MKPALVLLSGGQDSATCLAWAKQEFGRVHTISFHYGQRHSIEIDFAKKLSELAEVESFTVLDVPLFKLGDSALFGNGNVLIPHRSGGDLPATFVPGRNMVFLALAAAQAFKLGLHHLVGGMCQTDFSGYPDCRDGSIKAVQVAASLCLDYPIYIHTPLMWKMKAQTVLMMKDLGRLDWYKYTHTCYEGQRPPCGKCPACRLREKGFEVVGIKDPLLEEDCGK